MKDLNRYQREFAAEKIEGYLNNTIMSRQGLEVAFEKARAEAVKAYEGYLEQIKSLTLDHFIQEQIKCGKRYDKEKR